MTQSLLLELLEPNYYLVLNEEIIVNYVAVVGLIKYFLTHFLKMSVSFHLS
jgi:short-subunit dehydrogenase involved in D-alanine esterification of teichoic acids